MKVILFTAMSVNGMIARENGEEDFLSDKNWDTFAGLARDAGAIIWGRKTHEAMQGWGKAYADSIKSVRKIVVSEDPNFVTEEEYEVARSPQEAIEILRQAGFQNAILPGGAMLNRAFAAAGLVDEVIVNVEPVVVGKGIPMFAPEAFDLNLEFAGIERLAEGIVKLRYRVKK